MKKMDIAVFVLGILTFLAISLSLYMAFIYTPLEKTMGAVQKIFYFHLPLAWIGFLAFFIVFLGGVLYLITGSIKWDNLAYSSAEIGVVFSTLVLITGSIWAKRAWNTWWTWDPRLTTMLILWMIYVGYIMMRNAVDNIERRAKISAVIGIAGFVDVPIVFMAIRWWRTMHPLLITSKGMGLAPSMLTALFVSLASFTLLYVYLLLIRVRLGTAMNIAEEIKIRLSDKL